MLVFISDLHLDDRTGGVQFLPADAFTGTFHDIAQHARNAGSRRVEIVLLGDVFDLVRTTGWFSMPEAERPWGVTADLDDAERAARLRAVERRAGELLEKIIDRNRRTFDVWQGAFKDQFGFVEEPTRVYIPGNHDRICNQFASLRARAAQVLGIQRDAGIPFDHFYKNDRYQVFARHGQEWDPWNVELPKPLPLDRFEPIPFTSYMEIPIGEVIAAELASKLAPSVYLALEGVIGDANERARIADQLKTVDDVRPLAALIPWLLDKVRDFEGQGLEPAGMAAIKEGINQVLRDFERLAFVRQWNKKHGSWSPFDHVNLLRGLIWLGERISIQTVEHLLPLADRVNQGSQGDNFASKAWDDFVRLDTVPSQNEEFLYVLYGHTHSPAQVPIATTIDGRPRTYLNTGTWRPSHRRTLTGRGFVSTKGLTYTVIYHPEDDPDSPANANGFRYSTFETWTGTLLEHPVLAHEVDE